MEKEKKSKAKFCLQEVLIQDCNEDMRGKCKKPIQENQDWTIDEFELG